MPPRRCTGRRHAGGRIATAGGSADGLGRATEGAVATGGVALELLAHVDREGREVVEVEALELVVAEDYDHVGLELSHLVAQGLEALLDALTLPDVLFERV